MCMHQYLDQFFFCDPVVLELICYCTRAKGLINEGNTTGGVRKIWTERSSPQSKKQTDRPSEGGFDNFRFREVKVAGQNSPIALQEGPEMVMKYLCMVLQPILSAREQSWQHNSQWCVVCQVCHLGHPVVLLSFFSRFALER